MAGYVLTTKVYHSNIYMAKAVGKRYASAGSREVQHRFLLLSEASQEYSLSRAVNGRDMCGMSLPVKDCLNLRV